MTTKSRNIFIGVTIVIIIAIVYAMINTASTEQNTGTDTGGLFNNILNTDIPTNESITLDYYEVMMDLIMKTNGMPVAGWVYSEWPVKGYVEELDPLFYSGDRYEFDNVVNKRMLGIIPMKKPQYLINGEVTEPGALIDAYVEVHGSFYIDELTDLFNDFKAEYLKTI